MFPYKAVLFDMDGVIMDSMGPHTLAWQEVFLSLGRDVSKEFILQNEGSGDIFVWMKRLYNKDLSPASPPAVLEEARELMRSLGRKQRTIFFSKYLDQVKPYPGALPLLTSLKDRQIPCALVTSSSRETAAAIVPEAIKKCIAVMVGAEDVTEHKPQPEPYMKAAARLMVAPADCLAVENSPGGIKSAVSAGALCVGISSTLAPSYLCQASRVFASLEDLRTCLGLS